MAVPLRPPQFALPLPSLSLARPLWLGPPAPCWTPVARVGLLDLLLTLEERLSGFPTECDVS